MYKYYSVTLSLVLLALVLTACGGPGKVKDFIPPVYPPPPEKARFIYERTLRSSADVKELTTMEKMKVFATGKRDAAYGLGKPYGIAVYRGRVYISDTVQRIVMMFDYPGRDFKIIGNDGPGKLLKPIGLSIDYNTGTLYVADNTGKRVVAFDQQGKFIRAYGGPEILRRPSGVSVSPDGSKIYVVDTGGVDSTAHHLYVFNASDGELLKKIGSRGRLEGQFNLPLQTATAKDGTIYVVDGGNFRVQGFNPDGSFKMAFGSVGRRGGQFSRPKGIATDADGNIYVADAAFGNFQIFNSKGQLLMHIGDRGAKGRPGEYFLPAGLAVDEDGRVYIVDQFFKKVDIFRPADLQKDEGYLSTGRPAKPK